MADLVWAAAALAFFLGGGLYLWRSARILERTRDEELPSDVESGERAPEATGVRRP